MNEFEEVISRSYSQASENTTNTSREDFIKNIATLEASLRIIRDTLWNLDSVIAKIEKCNNIFFNLLEEYSQIQNLNAQIIVLQSENARLSKKLREYEILVDNCDLDNFNPAHFQKEGTHNELED